MSRIYRVRFACLAVAVSICAVATLTLTLAAGAKPVVPAGHMSAAASTASSASPLPTPSPEAGSIPTPMSASADLLPSGLSLPGVIAVLAVAALMGGISVMISRGPAKTRRVREPLVTIGKAVRASSAGRPVGRAA
jgi:hypothetical protein